MAITRLASRRTLESVPAVQIAVRGGRSSRSGMVPPGRQGASRRKATTRPATGGVTAAAIWGGAMAMLHALVWQQGMPCGSSGWQGDDPP
jgi:hypothetical protein